MIVYFDPHGYEVEMVPVPVDVEDSFPIFDGLTDSISEYLGVDL